MHTLRSFALVGVVNAANCSEPLSTAPTPSGRTADAALGLSVTAFLLSLLSGCAVAFPYLHSIYSRRSRPTSGKGNVEDTGGALTPQLCDYPFNRNNS